MLVLEGSRVDFVLKRIPLDIEYESPISASHGADEEEDQRPEALVSVSVFHEALSGNAEEGDLRTAPPVFFEVYVGEARSPFFEVNDAVQSVRAALALDAAEADDVKQMLIHTTSKKHTKSSHLTSFKLDKAHWEWCYETQGEIEPTWNDGTGLLVHATVWHEAPLSRGETPADCEFEEAALDPFDEEEFAGLRHRQPIPR